MPIEESQKSYPSKGRRKKKSPKRNGDYCNEVVEWARARGPAGRNTARNATISNTQMKNRTANTKRVVCVPTCKGAVPGHAGGTVVRGISRELR